MLVAANKYKWAVAVTLMGAGTILAQNAPASKEPPPLRPVTPKPETITKVAAAPKAHVAPTPVFVNDPVELSIGEIRMLSVQGKIKRIALGPTKAELRRPS